MITKLKSYLRRLQNSSRVNLALSRAAATSALRIVDPKTPPTWEFSGFSQNGEDGIIDFLTKQIKSPNRYFIEIGAGNGWENNTSWLAIAQRFSGIMIEGSEKQAEQGKKLMAEHNVAVDFMNLFVTKENVSVLAANTMYKDCDLFSLDIDGNDYYLAKTILDAGFKPKIFVVEYNSVFGPEKALTVEYKHDFDYTKAHKTLLYYGVSIEAWKKFFKERNYEFVTVDSNGVNAFFIDPDQFDSSFVKNLNGHKYRENFYQIQKFKMPWVNQFELIKDQKFMEIR